jgi:hypothetical protein
VQIGEVAPTAAGNQYFSADLRTMVEQANGAPALAGTDGAHHAGAARSNYDYVKPLHLTPVLAPIISALCFMGIFGNSFRTIAVLSALNAHKMGKTAFRHDKKNS